MQLGFHSLEHVEYAGRALYFAFYFVSWMDTEDSYTNQKV